MTEPLPLARNIVYETPEIARFFTEHRIKWSDFYESERAIIESLAPVQGQRALDIGCGCGGLGLALRAEFGVDDYTGVEINAQAASVGRTMNPSARIIEGDILDVSRATLAGDEFDLVFSLSCFDWNVQFSDMLVTAWRHVRSGGHLVATFRLTSEDGCDDSTRSYQYINSAGLLDGERAPYVVMNAAVLMEQLTDLGPSHIAAFGYWGSPSATAVTPYSRLCFAAFAVRKGIGRGDDELRRVLDLPPEIRDAIDSPRR